MSATIAVPALALTGAQDGCVDTRMYDITMSTKGGRHPLFPKGLTVQRIQGAGHFLHQVRRAMHR
jgi:alpha-beta hydrolase superfamily lysophospholipase